eukprot:SAG22_NODE_1190_length_5206_cov_1.878990_3_plen_179_part_00
MAATVLLPLRLQHREFSGEVGLAASSEFYVSSLQVFFYLDDALSRDGHTLMVVPESVPEKRRLPVRTDERNGRRRLDDAARRPPWPAFRTWPDSLGREQVVRPDGVDVFVKAGAAVLMNNSNFHAGAVRQTGAVRRTISAVYRAERPTDSSHGLGGAYATVHAFREALPARLRAGARL